MKKLWILLLPFAFMACQQANESHVYMLKQTESLLQANIELVTMKTVQLFKQMNEKKQDTLTVKE
jgi:hypothetical protein